MDTATQTIEPLAERIIFGGGKVSLVWSDEDISAGTVEVCVPGRPHDEGPLVFVPESRAQAAEWFAHPGLICPELCGCAQCSPREYDEDDEDDEDEVNAESHLTDDAPF